MVMRTLRENTKWIMMILTLAFVAWLVFEGFQDRQAGAGQGANPVVGLVNGEEIHYSEWSRHLDQYRSQARAASSAALTDEESHELEEEAWSQLVDQILVRQQMQRLGIEVTDSEIRHAFRTSPPPQLRSHPAFQTDGRFDIQKYRSFFSQPGVDEQLLRQIEQYYRDVIPRSKLFRMVAEGAYVSEDEAWETFRTRNETARVRYVSVSPGAVVPDEEVSVSRAEIEAYHRDHRDRFSRPPSARVRMVSVSTAPFPEDTARARSRVDSLRRVLASGEVSFARAAEEVSADSATASDGGLMGEVTRSELAPPLADAAFSLPVGRVSEPVATGRGFHLLTVDERRGDTATVRHILVPIRLSRPSEDEIFDRLDNLERIALRQGLGPAADSVGLEMREDVVLSEGSRFVPGAGPLGVAVKWALNPVNEPVALSRFFENATGFHMLELVDRSQGGPRPLAEVEEQIRESLLARKKKERAREALAGVVASVRDGSASLEGVAAERGWDLRTSDRFTRLDPVPGLGRATEAIGAAFGLAPGEVAGPLEAGERLAIVELLEKDEATREAFQAQRRQLHNQLAATAQQQWISRWMESLRETAEIQDLRHRLDQQRQQAQGTAM